MPNREPSNRSTKSPEEWLEKLAPEKASGTFKLFLGYAPGVGKTYNMLSEAIRRHQRGEDIVIGVVETHGRPRTAELADQLEQIPRGRSNTEASSSRRWILMEFYPVARRSFLSMN